MRRPLVWLAVAVCVITFVACVIYYRRIDRFWGITQTDFSVFYDAGQRVSQRQSMYAYRPTRFTTDPEYLFKYAPPFGLAMMPLARLGINAAIRWWYALTCLALLGMLACTHALLRSAHTAADLPPLAYLLIGLTILRPYLATLRLGQVDAILACLLLGFLVALSRGRDVAAGWCLGAAALCKLAPALWLVYLVAIRRWRAVRWTVIAMGAYLASPIIHLGVNGTWDAIGEWFTTLQQAGGNWEWLVRYKNQSVLSLVLRTMTGGDAASVTPSRLAMALSVTTLLGLIYGWYVWRAIRRTDVDDPLTALVAPSLAMIATTVFSPHAWTTTFVHLLLPYAVLIAALVTRAPGSRLLWGILVSSFLLVSATAPGALLGRATSHLLHVLSPMTWGAALLAVGLWQAQGVRAGRSAYPVRD